jgi:RNA polymerase sigma factor (sigma-70 family)
METESDHSITRLLSEWREGDQAALTKVTALVYQELRAMAQRHLRRERQHHTIQSTALVHEVFLRLAKQHSIDWQSRGQFFALASHIMRRILVDYARGRLTAKRGRGMVVLSLDSLVERSTADVAVPNSGGEEIPEPKAPDSGETVDVAAVDEALTKLATLDSRQAQIVEMRYFGGLTVEETAQALDLSDATVKREWTLARAWLRRELGGP